MTTAPGDPLGCVHLGVHRIGGHHRLVQVQRFEKLSERGDLVGLAGHPLLGQHGAGGVVQSGQEMGHRHLPPTSPAHGLAIHRDHSASVDGAGAYAHHDLRWASTSAGSRSCRTRRMDDCRGQGLVRRWSQGLQVGAVRSVVCSHIAVRLRQPASTPVTARDRTVGRSWRTPRLSRGSVMLLRTLVGGWRDRAVVMADNIGAGSQDEGMIRHRLSFPTGPRPVSATHHPRQSGSDTLAHRLCRPPVREASSSRAGRGSR